MTGYFHHISPWKVGSVFAIIQTKVMWGGCYWVTILHLLAIPLLSKYDNCDHQVFPQARVCSNQAKQLAEYIVLLWWLRWSRICQKCKRSRFSLQVGKTPWRMAWQPTPVFLPGEAHAQRSLVGYSPWYLKESDTAEQLPNMLTHTLKDCATIPLGKCLCIQMLCLIFWV